MARIVSLTPARLDRDSRTLKEALSFARLGHESTVVEGLRSRALPDGLPFGLLTLESVGESLAGGGAGGPTAAGPRWVERAAGVLGRIAGPLYFLASWAAFNARTARRLPPADLYWLHGYEQALAVWLRRAPYVYDAHDLYWALPYDGRPLTRRERALHAVRERIERAAARRATACVTTSAAMARACSARFGVPFAVVRNAQDAELARPAASDVRRAAGVDDATFLVVMVGQHKPGTVVPEGLPPGVHLVFVGDRYEGEPPPGVSFVGSVAPEQVAAFIATADAAALLYVPVNENSPAQLVNGLFHAVSAGLPLLLPAGMEAIRELGEELALGVVVDPADPVSLAAGIDALRADLETHRAAVRAAAPALSWAVEADSLESILKDALSK